MRRRNLAATACALLLLQLAIGSLAPGSAAAAAPRWEALALAEPTNFNPALKDGENLYTGILTNIGDAAQSGGPITLTDQLPPGVTATGVNFVAPQFNEGVLGEYGTEPIHSREQELCTLSASLVTCTWPGTSELPPLRPEQTLVMDVHVALEPGLQGPLSNSFTVSGGGAPDSTGTVENPVGQSSFPFGFAHASIQARNEDGSPYTQAGGHPYELTTTLAFNTERHANGETLRSAQQPRDILTELPPGLLGDPLAGERCSLADFQVGACPQKTQVGIWHVWYNLGGQLQGPNGAGAVYNIAPSPGQAAALGVQVGGGPTFLLVPSLRSGGDYGLQLLSSSILRSAIPYLSITVWGDPAAPGHAPYGNDCLNGTVWEGSCPLETKPSPFLTMPTSCSGAPLPVGFAADSWVNPGLFATADTTLGEDPLQGCNQIPFAPSISAKPTTNHADSPSGLSVDLELPQHFDKPEALATADLRDATVTLPKGITVNPSSANGREACSEAQIGYEAGTSAPLEFTNAAAQCPDAAKLGEVEIETPLLDHPIGNGSSADPAGDLGAVYLAKPFQNPFGSLLALYLVVEDPQTGVLIKLAGKVSADPQTGQLTTSFEENPQLPFEHFRLKFFEGAGASLRTPPTCGEYETTAALTPWSHTEVNEAGETIEATPIAHKSDSFEITGSASGSGPCPASAAEEPNAPVFHAGTENVQAGQFSPFAFKLRREDGSQEFAKIETTLPPGLVGRLAGVGECSEAQIAQAQSREHEGGGEEEQASPSCPASSEVGTVEVGTGAGPTPYYTQGKAYLAGPYKNAPLSLAIITPAVAGPFDLGAVVVRTALYVEPETAQIKAVSDEIPHILQGIPLDVRSVTLKMNRPNFTLNPTDCEEMGFTGNETSLLGSLAPLSQRFQVSGCSALGFSPKLSISLKGSTKRAGHPALKAVLTMPQPGKKFRCGRHRHCTVPPQANIARAQVTLPHAEFLDQGHIQNVCTQVQFHGAGCPKSSILGYAKAETPLLDHPLEGPVYLMSGFGHKLPDLAADLNGQIRVLLHGKVDTGPGGGIRNTFEVVPDAPVSKFILSLKGGSKGLIVNSENLCSPTAKRHAIADFTAQNGKLSDTEPIVHNGCKKHGGKKKHRHGRHR